MGAAELLTAALDLSPEDREELAQTLLDGLYVEGGGLDLHPAWADELEARCRALDEGQLSTRPAAQVLAELRSALMSREG